MKLYVSLPKRTYRQPRVFRSPKTVAPIGALKVLTSRSKNKYTFLRSGRYAPLEFAMGPVAVLRSSSLRSGLEKDRTHSELERRTAT